MSFGSSWNCCRCGCCIAGVVGYGDTAVERVPSPDTFVPPPKKLSNTGVESRPVGGEPENDVVLVEEGVWPECMPGDFESTGSSATSTPPVLK